MQQLQTVRSDSSDPKLQFKEVMGFRTQVVTHLFPVKKGGRSLHQNKPSLAPGSGSDPSSCSPSLLSAIPQHVKGWNRTRLCFTLEEKTWVESEILAHLTVISTCGSGWFCRLSHKSAFPLGVEVEICCSPQHTGRFALMPLLCGFVCSGAEQRTAALIAELWVAQTRFT